MSGSDAVDARDSTRSASSWIRPDRPQPSPNGAGSPSASALARLSPAEPWSRAAVTATEHHLAVLNGSLDVTIGLHDIVNVFELGEPGGATSEIEIEQRSGAIIQLTLDDATLSDLLDKLVTGASAPEPIDGQALLDPPAAVSPAGWLPPATAPAVPPPSPIPGSQPAVTPPAVTPPPYLGTVQPAPNPPDVTPPVGAPEPEPQGTCPYCQTVADGEVTECPTCHANHHRDCWIEAGGCAMVGCAQSSGSPPNSAPPSAGGAGSQPWAPTATTPPGAPSAWASAWNEVSPPSASLRATETPAVTATQPPATRRTWPKLVVGLLLIGLPIASAAATASNWFEPLVGRLYTATELRAAEASARNEGRSQGYDAGYDEGKATGLDEGFETGFEAGCTAVFEAANSSLLYDSPSYSYSYSYGTRSYVSKSSCYG